MAWPVPELDEFSEEEVYLGSSDGKPKVMFAVKTTLQGERIYRVIPLDLPESYYCGKCGYRHFGFNISRDYFRHCQFKLAVSPQDQ